MASSRSRTINPRGFYIRFLVTKSRAETRHVIIHSNVLRNLRKILHLYQFLVYLN